MATPLTFDDPEPEVPGYRSAEDRRRFTAAMIALAVTVFLGTMFTSILLQVWTMQQGNPVLNMMPASATSGVAVFGDRLFLSQLRYDQRFNPRTELESWDLKTGKPADKPLHQTSDTCLGLWSDGTRLVMLTDRGIVEFDGPTAAPTPIYTTGHVPPDAVVTTHAGRPAVFRRAAPYTLSVLEENAWVPLGDLDVPAKFAAEVEMIRPGHFSSVPPGTPTQVQVVEAGGKLHCLVETSQGVWYHPDVPLLPASAPVAPAMSAVLAMNGMVSADTAPDAPQEADADSGETPPADALAPTPPLAEDLGWRLVEPRLVTGVVFYKLCLLEGRPAIAQSRLGTLEVLSLGSDGWELATTVKDPAAGPRIDGMYLQPHAAGGPWSFVFKDSDTYRVHEFDGRREVARHKVRTSRIDRGIETIAWQSFFGWLLGISLTGVLILGTTFLMHRFRLTREVVGPRTIIWASVLRRAVGFVVDSLIAFGPPYGVVGWWLATTDWATLFETNFARPGRFDQDTVQQVLGLVAFFFGWMFFAFVALSVTEGLWGWTPGKLLAGIRCYRSTLRPCGIIRSAARRLLLMADLFFNGLVGILLIAFQPRWQRLGDMAVDTIVVRTPASPPAP